MFPTRATRIAAGVVTALTLVVAEGAEQQRRGNLLVEFRALDGNGQPVLDLKPGDLILRAGGRERAVASLELISRREGGTTSLAPPPFAANSPAQSDRREVFVLIDEASIAPGREPVLRDTLTHFLTRLSARDRVRLISLRPPGPVLPFEEGVRDLPAALTRFSGHAAANENANDLVCRTRTSLDRMQALFENYSGGPIPTFVIVSAGFGSPPAGAVTSFGNYGRCPVLQSIDFENLGSAARAINAAIYVVHLTDASASQIPRTELERGVETLAGALSADVIRGAAPSPMAMGRIVTETSAYYLASFEPTPEDRADTPMRVELRARRADVTVRVRPEIAGPPRGAAAGKDVPTPDAMIRVATPYRDLPLRAAGFASRADADGKVRLVVLFEPEDPATKITAASIGLYDASGRLTRWTAEASDLNRRPLLAGIIVTPGTYRMRVAAASRTSAGAVDTEVRAELSDAVAMKMSALLLGVSGANGFEPRMQFTPADKGAFGYLEIYQVPKNAAVTVALELAETVDGPAVAHDTVALTPGPKDDVRIAFSGFAIDGMPPGDIVMRAVVTLDGNIVGRAHRTVRKVK